MVAPTQSYGVRDGASFAHSKHKRSHASARYPAYEALPQVPNHCPLPFKRTIRRQELRQIVPLSETTIYEMERRGEFPRRFNLAPRCVLWDLAEVEAWIEERKQAPRTTVSGPDVRLRKTRPVRADSDEV